MRFSEICDVLSQNGIEESYIEAEILIEELLGETVSDDREYDSKILSPALEKRCQGYPLQYIIGKWWFARCVFEVNESCLVPRPDTETVVEQAVKLIPSGARFADLCTGSGCIAIALADLRADLYGVAVELYPQTLEIAKRNAKRNKVSDRLSFIEGDVLSGDVLGGERFDAIISNPPYIKSQVIDTLSREVLHEPRVALDGGEDGLIFYRTIVEKYRDNLENGGAFIFEIGYDQASDLEMIAEKHGMSCEIVKDLGGNDRVAILR